MFYTTTTYVPGNMNDIHMEMSNKCEECFYYVESTILEINIEEWKLTVENPIFVQVIPDQEEISIGTVYIIKYFGDASNIHE